MGRGRGKDRVQESVERVGWGGRGGGGRRRQGQGRKAQLNEGASRTSHKPPCQQLQGREENCSISSLPKKGGTVKERKN
jgi:hypothetical protein